MYERPSVSIFGTTETTVPVGFKELWLKALDRPDAELQRMVVDTLAIAHKRGMKGLSDAKPRMLELARKPDQNVDVLRAIAQTLIVMTNVIRRRCLPNWLSNMVHRWANCRTCTGPLEFASDAKGVAAAVTDADSSQTMMTLAMMDLACWESQRQLIRSRSCSKHRRIAAAADCGSPSIGKSSHRGSRRSCSKSSGSAFSTPRIASAACD